MSVELSTSDYKDITDRLLKLEIALTGMSNNVQKLMEKEREIENQNRADALNKLKAELRELKNKKKENNGNNPTA